MKLHENKKIFSDAVIATAQQLKIPEIFVEKDYWVTYILWTLFENEVEQEVVFKGGTALSKCYSIIDRFSEDIDLVVLHGNIDSSSHLKRKLKSISNIVNTILPEVKVDGLTNKKGKIRKTVHKYEKLFKGVFGQVRENIVLETTCLGLSEPYEIIKINSLICDMMDENNQMDYINKYNLEPFVVNALNPRRTLCEKIMSLVRFSYSENPIADLSNKVRHIYDIYKIINVAEYKKFFISNEFETLLKEVAIYDVKSFNNNNEWLKNHPVNCLIFSDVNVVWEQLKSTYNSSFRELVYGDFPNQIEMLYTLESIANQLTKIDKWDVKIK